MSLDELYKQIVIDHYRSPRNKGELPVPPAHYAQGFNPLCGDHCHIWINTDNDTITDIKVNPEGCSIFVASASMMTAAVKGQNFGAVEDLTQRFKTMLAIHEQSLGTNKTESGDTAEPNEISQGAVLELGDLEALQGVVAFPIRIKCAVLAWNTLADAVTLANTD